MSYSELYCSLNKYDVPAEQHHAKTCLRALDYDQSLSYQMKDPSLSMEVKENNSFADE